MRKSGFTMIELIFVIVILGILAAVAIPKLNATRTDAKNSAIMQQVQSAVSEIPQYVVAHGGDVNATPLTTESQVLKHMVDAKQAKENADDNVTIYGNDKASKCLEFDTNDTALIVRKVDDASKPACKRIVDKVLNGQDEVNYTIAGSQVTY